MMTIVAILIAIGIMNCLHNINKWQKRKRNIGEIEYVLLDKINIRNQKNRIYICAWVIAVLIGLYLIATRIGDYSNYIYLMGLLIVLTEIPKWKIAIGKKGIIINLEVIKWEQINSCELNEAGEKYILIKWLDSSTIKQREKRVYSNQIDRKYSFIKDRVKATNN
jgi:competence protein ComGC